MKIIVDEISEHDDSISPFLAIALARALKLCGGDSDQELIAAIERVLFFVSPRRERG